MLLREGFSLPLNMRKEMNINELKDRVLAGGQITKDEARAFYNLSDEADKKNLYAAAYALFQKFCSNKADLCSLINAKSGECSEDCSFCAQSGHYNTNVTTYALKNPEEILAKAKQDEANGSHRFCIVTSGGALSDEEFERVIDAYKLIQANTSLALDGSLGLLSDEQINRLKDIGVTRINHNLETSENFYSSICTTHKFSDRVNTIKRIKAAGIEVCAGGIIGLGESREDRIDMAFSLSELEVESVPINILNPRPGTPLKNNEKLSVEEILKTISIFRFILPRAVIKIAGGREVNLGDCQVDALRAGANGIIVGGYLTTAGNPVENDLNLIKSAGMNVD